MAENLPQIGSLRVQNVTYVWTNEGFLCFSRGREQQRALGCAPVENCAFKLGSGGVLGVTIFIEVFTIP